MATGRRAWLRTVARVTALPCPVERAVAVTKIARRRGTLSPALAALRRLALAEALRAGHRVGALAAATRLTHARVCQLLGDRNG